MGEESYTSKCDALNWEDVGWHEEGTYSGERLTGQGYRGLFLSGKDKNETFVNSDVNGAINIMRKGLTGNDILLEELKEGIQEYKKICNPIVIKIKREHREGENGVIEERKKKYVIEHTPAKAKRRRNRKR